MLLPWPCWEMPHQPSPGLLRFFSCSTSMILVTSLLTCFAPHLQKQRTRNWWRRKFWVIGSNYCVKKLMILVIPPSHILTHSLCRWPPHIPYGHLQDPPPLALLWPLYKLACCRDAFRQKGFADIGHRTSLVFVSSPQPTRMSWKISPTSSRFVTLSRTLATTCWTSPRSTARMSPAPSQTLSCHSQTLPLLPFASFCLIVHPYQVLSGRPKIMTERQSSIILLKSHVPGFTLCTRGECNYLDDGIFLHHKNNVLPPSPDL